MVRKTAVIAMVIMLLTVLLVPVAAMAASGEVILHDTLYGGLIGGLLGGAWYLLDQDNAADKMGTGIGVGIIGGFILGVTDATASINIENGKVEYAMPQIFIYKDSKSTVYTAHLLEANF